METDSLIQLAGWAGIILTLVAAVLYPLYETARRHERMLDRLNGKYDEHTGDGHPLRFEESVRANILAVDERNRVLQKQLDGVAEKMALLHAHEREQTARAIKWIDSDGSKIGEELASLRERVAALERREKLTS